MSRTVSTSVTAKNAQHTKPGAAYHGVGASPRPLRAVELALGDSIILGPAPFEANSFPRHTFRNIMRHYHANYPWYQFGIDLALGSGIDYELSRREMAFAPAEGVGASRGSDTS